MESKHTPTLLTVNRQILFGNTIGIQGINVYVDGMHIGSYTGEIDLNNDIEKRAAFSAKAVNCHDDLVKQLQDMYDFIIDRAYAAEDSDGMKSAAAILTKAGAV